MKRIFFTVLAVTLLTGEAAFAAHNQAPEWMHALVNVPVPAHDEKTSAVLLYANENLTVLSAGKFRTTIQRAYKILRPEGRDYGLVEVSFDSVTDKVTSLHAWCIPAAGKDYEVTDKDAVDRSYLKDESESLMSSERVKMLQIPAPDPGNIVGYEYTEDWHPPVLQDQWGFQRTIPVRESHYSLALPEGWEYKAVWENYSQPQPHNGGGGVWQWAVGDVKAIRPERAMPPWQAIAGRMVVTLFPPGGQTAKSLPTWHELGEWYIQLTKDRLEASPEIKQEVGTLTASRATPLAKMRAVAHFIQSDFRYVAISLGIGGIQPHAAADIFEHRYGDCKDKATLMRTMLHEAGVESYYVVINHERDAVTPQTPAHIGAFDHVVVAIKLPDGTMDTSLVATLKHPTLGTLLFYDPTSENTPFGHIPDYLQANYGMLVTPAGGELVELPQEPATMNGLRRTGKLTLSADGTLQGEVQEARVGEYATEERELFIAAAKASDRIKPVESRLADALAAYRLTYATISNLKETDNPFLWQYSFQAPNYAKAAGNLLLVRPRVLGRESSGVLETTEPRLYPIEFEGPVENTDNFEITLPPGYAVDDLPPAIDADFPFASYHARTEVRGNVLHYQRTFEVKELSVPVSEAPQLRKFYRIIASDERNTAVLKPAAP